MALWRADGLPERERERERERGCPLITSQWLEAATQDLAGFAFDRRVTSEHKVSRPTYPDIFVAFEIGEASLLMTADGIRVIGGPVAHRSWAIAVADWGLDT
ncbi:hypothetical protein LIA77_04216 [Sarocladium implicatum]|nr:hypothetical protein LIA77_04216 [Sarocladium implicatum]